jgi:hypothetical protein
LLFDQRRQVLPVEVLCHTWMVSHTGDFPNPANDVPWLRVGWTAPTRHIRGRMNVRTK